MRLHVVELFYNRYMDYRYYIGLQLPADISGHIQRVQHQLFDAGTAIEPLEPHVTLVPPPALERISPEDFIPQAKTAAKTFLPLEITLSSVVAFDGRAVAISVESPGIIRLQETLISLLPGKATVRYYPQPSFSPHVTLNQAIRGKMLPPDLVQRYQEQLGGLLPAKCAIAHLTLFRWIGPRQYRAETI